MPPIIPWKYAFHIELAVREVVMDDARVMGP